MAIYLFIFHWFLSLSLRISEEITVLFKQYHAWNTVTGKNPTTSCHIIIYCKGPFRVSDVAMSRTVKQLFDLTGKTALVTGGSRGLGLQMAAALGWCTSAQLDTHP